MKKISLIVLLLFGLLVVACSPAETSVAEPELDQASAEPSDTVQASAVEECSDEDIAGSRDGYTNVMYTERDLDAFLASTRPKFVVAYAPW